MSSLQDAERLANVCRGYLDRNGRLPDDAGRQLLEAVEALVSEPPRAPAGGKDYRPIARNLFDALRRIARDYHEPEGIRRDVERKKSPVYGFPFEEALEMAYDNLQAEARGAIEGMRRP